MIRNGLYAIYEGREYAAAKTDGGHIKLIYTGSSAPEGFEPTPYGNFVMIVSLAEISELFMIKSYAVVDGESLEIEGIEDGVLTVGTSNEKTADQLHMQKADRFDYRMKIRAEDVEDIVEQRRLTR